MQDAAADAPIKEFVDLRRQMFRIVLTANVLKYKGAVERGCHKNYIIYNLWDILFNSTQMMRSMK